MKEYRNTSNEDEDVDVDDDDDDDDEDDNKEKYGDDKKSDEEDSFGDEESVKSTSVLQKQIENEALSEKMGGSSKKKNCKKGMKTDIDGGRKTRQNKIARVSY